ncbi:MAG: gliding motility-associated C-terminal domain-containing protein [Bacteroidota bacterium]
MKKGFTFVGLVLLIPFLTRLSAKPDSGHFSPTTTAMTILADAPERSEISLNDTLVNLPDTVYVQVSNCAQQGQVCLDISPSEIGNFQITNNGFPYTGGLLACDIDTFFNYTYLNLPAGPYVLQSWFVNGEFFTGQFADIEALVDSMNVWDTAGSWTLDDTNQLITGGNPTNNYGTIIILVVQTGVIQFLDTTVEQAINGALLSFGVGLNAIRLVESTGGIDSFNVQVACIPAQTVPIDTLLPGMVDTFCLDFSELQAPLALVDGVRNICSTNGNATFQLIDNATCVEITSLTPGVDSACIVACDQLGFCDTTYLVASIQDPSVQRIREYSDVIFTGTTGQTCLDTTQLNGPVDTIYALCTPAETFATFDLNEEDLCLSYTGLNSGGIDTFCLVVCDATPLCDTNFVYVRVKRPGPIFVFESLFLNQEASFCDFDTANLDGTLVGIQNGCSGSSGNFVDFIVDPTTNCIDYVGVGIGQDTACLYLSDDQGGMDTTFVIVNVLPPNSLTRFDTLRVDSSVEFCLETDELGPNVLDTIFLCEEFTGTAVNIDLNPVSLCIDIEAVNPGATDTLCVYICDELQSCDTTNLILTVEQEVVNIPPLVNPDTISTPLNTSATIDVCANDSLFGATISNFFVLPVDNGGVGPNLGIAFGNAECSVMYIPQQDTCGLDSFSYVIRTEMGWDTTTVQVTIECPPSELKIFNAFSPNGDTTNPFFRIDGIENFPNHELFVYNRWGNLVLEARDYQNDWDGTWDGLDLPDGTYFYVFDDGEGNVLSGYVYLSR